MDKWLVWLLSAWREYYGEGVTPSFTGGAKGSLVDWTISQPLYVNNTTDITSSSEHTDNTLADNTIDYVIDSQSTHTELDSQSTLTDSDTTPVIHVVITRPQQWTPTRPATCDKVDSTDDDKTPILITRRTSKWQLDETDNTDNDKTPILHVRRTATGMWPRQVDETDSTDDDKTPILYARWTATGMRPRQGDKTDSTDDDKTPLLSVKWTGRRWQNDPSTDTKKDKNSNLRNYLLQQTTKVYELTFTTSIHASPVSHHMQLHLFLSPDIFFMPGLFQDHHISLRSSQTINTCNCLSFQRYFCLILNMAYMYSTVRLVHLNNFIYCIAWVSFHVSSLVVITFREKPNYHV